MQQEKKEVIWMGKTGSVGKILNERGYLGPYRYRCNEGSRCFGWRMDELLGRGESDLAPDCKSHTTSPFYYTTKFK